MGIGIETIGADRLADYAGVSIDFDVRSTLAIDKIGIGGLRIQEQPVAVPYNKNYDSSPDGGPLNWPARFDISNWGLWIAREAEEVIGGMAVAWNTPGFELLDGKSDVAVLWDIRVKPSRRRLGTGTALFHEAMTWAKSKGCRQLKIETQNVNVAACRFYRKMGCFLGRIDRLAYSNCPDVAGEAMLIWHLNLSS